MEKLMQEHRKRFGGFEAIEFVDRNTGWIAGGAIHKTTDGGSSWVRQAAPQYTLRDISFADAQHGWQVSWPN